MIKTLLFDFGDVFLNLDKQATIRELQKLGIKEFTAEMLLWNQAYEKGTISTETFIKNYQQVFPFVSKKSLLKAWNAILLDFPPPRLDFIQKLAKKKSFQLLLLSNTNEIHIDWVKNNIEPFDAFKACFDGFYLSHEIALRKPEIDCYQFILDQHHLKPEEILFIDDTKENTDAAKELGFQVWNIQPKKEDIIQLFKQKELFL
ncbi:MAG: haloacid dehalogenase [Flavobacteriaceae bacterium CG_4_8_14_3_um_filter_34_10]|nr:HAD family phosphatase [Flavobacteriia bacterium]OIP51716.1 MAG: haloacid dehalogenase [Flavobacteriaceae bacterium CG2_30_34_30]PIQ17109.1 MAG: haloacid dehalogenase [Flavobacteriaceae bacterium CG18_big_fil_WC_8_21_14_2_50_34_36]PIV48912.1 MAG: haloacid dehalogenase [Flavobacteriaceae bacterium CG02_land_8_20_14_3_00_34_13]PIX10488.1 MAG: haloacid dehalogenase [Flavobacteriaceae bacterium CG_4_8_14_3_um_filter_34_10]PIZ07956.1 MAG: haloacid dehalogenase [Flavobacteriaceae bacterium CG_4_1